MNRGQLITLVAAKSGLTADPGTEDLSLLQQWANDAVVDVLLETRCYVDYGDMALVAGSDTYRLNTNILAVRDASIFSLAGQGEYNVVSLKELNEYRRAIPVGGGLQKFIAAENDLIMIAPVPVRGDSMRFCYVPRPSPMT